MNSGLSRVRLEVDNEGDWLTSSLDVFHKAIKFHYPRNDRPPGVEERSQATVVFPVHTLPGRWGNGF